MKPFVLIGTGGSGGKTLRVVREVLRQRLQAAGWQEEWPQAWQLLHIDVPAVADGLTKELPYTLPRKDYFPLTDSNSTYSTFDHLVSGVKGSPWDAYTAYNSWRPFPPHSVHIDIINGAGQYRAVGRVSLMANLSRARDRIGKALNDAASAPTDVLARIQELMTGRQAALDDSRPMIIVAGSVAGGSGSGSLLDICDVLRASDAGRSLAFIFTPELFAQQSGANQGVAPNTFMAINELSNAMWVSAAEDSPATRAVVFARAGMADAKGRGGPDAAILVGSRNEFVHLGESTEIYMVTGRAIGEMMMSSDLLDSFAAVTLGNAAQQNLGDVSDYPVRLPDSTATPQYRGLGFARLSIGRDLLLRYSAERLARSGCERLLDYHLSTRTPGDPATDREMVERVASLMEPDFLNRAGLDEVGQDRNQVIDAIEPPDAKSVLNGWSARQTEDTLQHMGGKKADAADIRSVIAASVEAELQPGSRTVRGQFEASLNQRSSAWTKQLQTLLEQAVRASMSNVGLPVTMELLQRTRGRALQAASELEGDSRRLSQAANDRLAQLRTPQAGSSSKIPADEASIRPLIRFGRESLSNHCRSQQLIMAAVLLRDLAENLVKPWTKAVQDAEALLREEVRPANQSPSEVDYWPKAEGVPAQYRPSPVEMLLEDPDTFPTSFDQMIMRSVDDQDTILGAHEAAVRAILDGPPGAGNSTLRPVSTRRKDWIPEKSEVRGRSDLPTPAQIQINTTVDDILDRANRWIRNDEQYSGRFLRQSLEDYLTDPEVDAGVRQRRATVLTGQLGAMFRASAPLVSLNSTLLTKLYNRANANTQLVMTALNVPDDRKLRDALEDAAVAAGCGGQLKFTNQPSQGCQVFRVHNHTSEHFAFDSIMEPLADRWSQAENDKTLRNDFWRWRRTRPLLEWVPVDPDTRRAIVRGWLVGRFLGFARFTTDTQDRLRLQVHGDAGAGPTWLDLPAVGPRPISRKESPANVLELLPVAMIDAYRLKDLAPLRPWGALLLLATSDALSTWVTTGSGVRDDGDAWLDSATPAGPAGSAERLAAVKAILKDLEEQMKSDSVIAAVPDIADLQGSPLIEIRDDYLDALADLEKAAATGVEDPERRT